MNGEWRGLCDLWIHRLASSIQRSDRMGNLTRLPGQRRCVICERQITDQQARLHHTCDSWKCRREYRAKQPSPRRERLERALRALEELREKARRLRDEVAGLVGIERPELYVPLAIPVVERRLASLPAERPPAFREHLSEVVSEVLQAQSAGGPREATAPAESEEDRPWSHILRAACALCEGRCCREGADRAYLDVQAVGRFMDEHPNLRPEEVADAFLSQLGTTAYRDSCIFHGENGCGLPRPMRSGTCTSFECIEFRVARTTLSQRRARRAFLAAFEGQTLVRFAFVGGDGRVDQYTAADYFKEVGRAQWTVGSSQ
jgi:hypothetical protein